MTPYLQDADVTLWHGDVLDVLRELPAESVDCVVTSPPYWGLRDYGTGMWEGGDPECEHRVRENPSVGTSTLDGGKKTVSHQAEGFKDECPRCGARRVDNQLGLEPTPDAYVARMVAVFREVRRVLAPHGTCWVNLGSSFHNKQEQMIPARVALAFQADGWWLRSEIVWSKPNPMPESCTDRPTKSHEMIYLLTKQPRYFFDAEAVREQFEARPQQRLTANVDMPLGAARVAAGVQQGNPQGGTHVSRFRVQDETLEWCGCVEAGCGRSFAVEDCGCACHAPESPRGPDGRRKTTVQAGNGSAQHRSGERWPDPGGRNVRSVWTIATQPYPEAHFATYPEELVRRCVLAGCPERVCRTCGKASERLVETNNPSKHAADEDDRGWANTHSKTSNAQSSKSLHRNPGGVYSSAVTLGWSDCGHNDWRPGRVLDPFVGSGTTCKVARDHGRHSIGIDLSADYLELAARRLQQQSLFSEAPA